MNLSNLFGPGEAVEPQEFDSDRDAYCSCTGKSRNVLVSISDGNVSGIECTGCGKPPLFGGLEDDYTLISAARLPLVITTVDAWEVEEYVTERYDAYELTVSEGEAAA